MLSLTKSRLSGKTLFFVFIFILLSSFLYATIINVPADQPTIQAGINAATNSDTVLVQPGTYVENINFIGKLITVGSLFLTTQDSTYISSTYIDGNSIGRIITFDNSEDSTAVLCGFTIQNGFAQGVWPNSCGGGIYCDSSSPSLENVTISDNYASWGGGIYCGSNSSPGLNNITITGNSANTYGGGIFCSYSSPSLVNVTITGNTASNGGGIFYSHSSPSLQNVTITGNSGGGIYCSQSSPSLQNVIISVNSGCGICCVGSSPSLENVTITGNSANHGGGIYCWVSSPSLINSILWNDSPEEIYFDDMGDPNSITISYSDIQGGEAGIVTNNNGTVNWLEGNIDEDPLFVDPGNGDYHLQSTSPCIDAGDPASPLDPDGTIVDMGAYFFPQFIDADFTADTTNGYVPLTVNFTDLSTQGSGVIDEWLWDFGDGNNSSLQNPSNEYYYRGSYTVSLTVTDVNDSTDSETKVDYIMVLNSTPVVQNPITDFSFDEDTSNSSINLNNVFDDADLPYGDVLSFSYSGNTYIDVGIVSGIVTLTPDPDWFGFEDITFTATDDSLASINDEVRVTINPVNDAPVINSYDPSYSPVTIDETESQLFWVSASDIDGDPLSYQWYVDDVPQTGQTDSTYTHTTDYTSAGTYMIKCIVDDGVAERTIGFSRVSASDKTNQFSLDSESRATDFQEWQLIVDDVDQNIVVNDVQPAPGPVTIDEMDTIDFYFSGYDPDGNPLEYSWKLDGVEVSTDSTYLFETDYTSAGEYVVTLEVTDNFGTRRITSISRNTLNYSWDVTVNDVDQPIVVNELIPPEGDITIDEGDVINFSIDAYDPDGNNLEYNWQVEGVEVSTTNSFDFITDENSAGEYEVTLFVTDNFGTRDELNFLWNVTVNDVSGSGGVLIPVITKLFQNHPNPFNPITNIQFDIKENETGVLSIFNLKGQIIQSQRFESGKHDYLWNADNCGSGVYLYKLQTESFTETRKMLLLK